MSAQHSLYMDDTSRNLFGNPRYGGLLRQYQPVEGIPDELVGMGGQPKPYWNGFLENFAALAPSEIARRIAAVDSRLKDSGVAWRAFDSNSSQTEETGAERPWPLGPVPLLIPEGEWRQIAAGITQRASLIEAVLKDVYGPGNLVSQGALPAAAVTGSPDFLRPMHGIVPRGGQFLHLYAADLGRGPDGRWWVLGDRTQAPSGAGYALENRVALSRAFSDLYRTLNVERLAPFFQSMRSGLAALAERADPRICLMTPGALSETYFEQAYLARYLGFLLVEGADLLMQNGRVHVRTVAGLKRADVIWRRIDADFADPLELNAASQLGVPGLLDSLRNGSTVMANALGTGAAESRAMMSFLPQLCQRLLGEDLSLPNLATWWCGQPKERADVLERLDSLVVASAFAPSIPGFGIEGPIVAGDLPASERARLSNAIQQRGVDFVGQEIVRLSTMPIWISDPATGDGQLMPRPFVLRVYAAATPEGWVVMPGGFARVSDRLDIRAVSMREGAQSADVWVMAENPVAQTSLLTSRDAVRIRRITGNLPSRAADNMFWLGRYLERTEATLRLVRCLMGRAMEQDSRTPEGGRAPAHLSSVLAAWGAAPPYSDQTQPAGGPHMDDHSSSQSGSLANFAAVALHDSALEGSAIALAGAAYRSASVIRERLSLDSWHLLGDLKAQLERPVDGQALDADMFEQAERGLRIIASLSGLSQENMNRAAGWRFLEIGRRLERGVNTCRFTRHFASEQAPADDLDILLELIDSQISYRSRYLVGLALDPVRDMAVLDPYNPRSVAFQISRIDEHLATLPALREDGILEPQRRLALKLASKMASQQAESLNPDRIFLFEQTFMRLSEAISSRYFLQGPKAGRADKLKGLA